MKASHNCGCCRPMPAMVTILNPLFVQSARDWSDNAAMDKRQRLVDIPPDATPVNSALLRVMPKNLVVLPVPVREPGQGRDRACFRQLVYDVAKDLPRAAHRLYRHRAEQHRGDDADRRPVEAVAAARRRIADPAEGIAADQRATRARKRSSSPNATSKSSARTRKSNRPAGRWRKKPANSH